MKVAEKLRFLRIVEGQLRGLGREMTQKEVAGAVKTELGGNISQPYLSQLEQGQRKHLTGTSRLLLAQFFRVHPGYLVDDPEGFQTELLTEFQDEEQSLDLWLVQGAERFRQDQALSSALVKVAQHPDTRKCMLLLGHLVQNPDSLERLCKDVQPERGDRSNGMA